MYFVFQDTEIKLIDDFGVQECEAMSKAMLEDTVLYFVWCDKEFSDFYKLSKTHRKTSNIKPLKTP